MSLLNAFTYMFKGKKWYLPIIIGILIETPSFVINYFMKQASQHPFDNPYYFILLLLSVPVSLISSIFIGGYYFVNANRRAIKPDSEILQWSSIKDIVLSGLKSMGACFIYCIPYFIISIISMIVYFAVAFGSSTAKPSNTFMIVPIIFGIILGLLVMIAAPAFVTNLKFKSYFNFKLMFNLLKNNPKGFGLIILFTIATGITAGLIINTYSIWGLIISPILAFYIVLVNSELVAMYIRGAAKNNQ